MYRNEAPDDLTGKRVMTTYGPGKVVKQDICTDIIDGERRLIGLDRWGIMLDAYPPDKPNMSDGLVYFMRHHMMNIK